MKKFNISENKPDWCSRDDVVEFDLRRLNDVYLSL